MTNRVGRYFASGNGEVTDIERAALALAFCDSMIRVFSEGRECSSLAYEVLSCIEAEALRVFYHYGLQPPDPLGSV